MTEEKVLNEEEINNIKQIRNDFQALIGEIGEIEVGIMNLNGKKKELEIKLFKIQQEENKIAEELEKKYGNGNISIETGKFTPTS
jgi:hypothetical protein